MFEGGFGSLSFASFLHSFLRIKTNKPSLLPSPLSHSSGIWSDPNFKSMFSSHPAYYLIMAVKWKLNGGRAWHKDDLHILMKTSSPYNTISVAIDKYISDWILNQFKHNEFLNLNSCQFKFLRKMIYKWSECWFFLN